MKPYTHNPGYRMKYPEKDFYVFSECKINSFPWLHPDYKKREIIKGPRNYIPDRDHDEKIDYEEKEELCRD